MDFGTVMNAHMPIQAVNPPNRREISAAALPDTSYSGPARSLQAWGAHRARGAPVVQHVPPHLSGKALGPNPYGIAAYTVPDTETGAYRSDNKHGWYGVQWNQPLLREPKTWETNNEKGQHLML